MGPKPYREQLREQAHAALAGLEQAFSQTAEPGEAAWAALLEQVGDLHRLGERTPAWATRALARAKEADLTAVLDAYRAEVADWPRPSAPIDGLDGGFGPVLARRDGLQSAIVAISGLCLRRGRPPVALPGWSELLADKGAWDAAASATVPRGVAEALLGTRAALIQGHTWLDGLREDDNDSADGEAWRVAETGHAGAPDDATVQAYLHSGRLQRYVEGYAARSAEFAEELAETIALLQEIGELGDALAPRRWHRQYRGAGEAPLSYQRGPTRLAAADREQPGAVQTLELGAIAGLAVQVEASLELRGERATLVVEADGELAAVQLGPARATAPSTDGSWQVSCAVEGGRLSLRIEDSAGGSFEDVLSIDDGA